MTVLLIIILVLAIFILFLVGQLVFLTPSFKKASKKFWNKIIKRKNLSNREMILEFSEKLANTLYKLSNDYVGALICLERNDPLNDYVEIGHPIQSKFSPELIFSVFYNKKSPLHDGAIIVRDGNIIAISSYFPTSNKFMDVMFGARHRAALGLSEQNDSITFVVSETNGRITMARNGKLTILPQNIEELYTSIRAQLLDEKTI